MIIKALTFDLDDTLYDNRPVIENMEKIFLTWLKGCDPTANGISVTEWQDIKRHALAQSPTLKHDVTQWRWHSLFLLFRQWGFSVSLASDRANEGVALSLVERQKVCISPLTHKILSQLQSHFPLVAITNGNVDIQKIGLESYFSAAFYAGKDGQAKPESDLFQLAEQYLNVAASSILHIGDHPISDVKGAQKMGFQTCWLNETSMPWAHSDFTPTYTIKTLADLLSVLSLT